MSHRDRESPGPDPEKTKLELEKLQLEVRKLSETVELERKMLDSQLSELRVAPRRTIRLALITTAASILTTFAIGILGFQINVAAALQRDNDTFRQLFQSIDADRPGIRASAALGLGSAFEKPPWFFAFLGPANRDRSRQAVVMLAERLKVETDPVVQLSIVDALRHVPASGEAAGALLGTSEHLSRRLQKALTRSARLNLVRIRQDDLGAHYVALMGDTASLDLPGADSTHEPMLHEWYIFSSRTIHPQPDLVRANVPPRDGARQSAGADAAVKSLAKQRMLIGQVVTRIVNDDPALVNSEKFFANVLLGVRLDHVTAPQLNWQQVFAAGRAAESNFDCANFDGSDLSELDMHGTTIRGASLQGAILPFDDAHLPNLDGADWLNSLNVKPADLAHANPFLVAKSNSLYLRFKDLLKRDVKDQAFTNEIQLEGDAKTACKTAGERSSVASGTQ